MHIYRICQIFVLLFITGFSTVNSAPTSVDINRYGRRIQLDGFLIEWNSKTAKSWNDHGTNWYWDAINTPEGLAGYFRSEGAVRCSSWTFTIDLHESEIPFIFTFPSDSVNNFYRTDGSMGDAKGVAIEWVLPWKFLTTDSSGTYALELMAINKCGDSLSPLLLTGTKQKPPSIISKRLIVQAVIIGILLLIYALVQIRIGNQKRRKGSLRQSAL